MKKISEAAVLRTYLEEKVRLEKNQLRAVTSGQKLIVVTAGAGTGKTLTLAWRFIWLVVAEDVPVDGILTITFTEKAALEMRERIKRLMEKLLEDEPSLSKRLQQALERLDEAYISTIHAFSMRVLKENALVLDLDPEARVTSGSEESSFWLELERIYDRSDFGAIVGNLRGKWVSRGEKTFAREELPDLVNTFGPGGLTSFAGNFINHFVSRGFCPEDIWQMSTSPEKLDQAAARELKTRFGRDWEEAFELWINEIIPSVDSEIRLDTDKTKFSAGLGMLRRRWEGATPGVDELPHFVADLFGEKGPLSNLTGSKSKKAADALLLERTGESCKEYRDNRIIWPDVTNFILEGLPSEEAKVRGILLETCALCWEFRDAWNSGRGILTFDDLISYALQAIKSSPRYRERFRHVLVDEFQDTNGLQYKMIQTISESAGCPLFLVGDLQQSIYRFRHAQPRIFCEVLWDSQTREDGEAINLDISFRSRGELMTRLNGLFSSVWDDGIIEGIQSSYVPLKAPDHHLWWKERQKGTMPAVTCLVAAPGENDENFGEKRNRTPVDQLRRASFEALARFIDESLSQGKTVWDQGEGTLRPLRYRDIAILVPSRTQYEALEEVLIENWGFPVYFEGNRNYFSRGEVRDVAAALGAMANPENELALASFLESPLSGLSLTEAAALLTPEAGRNGGEKLIERLARLHPDTAGRFLQRRHEARVSGPSRAIAAFLEDEKTLLSFPFWKRRRVAGNLRRAVDIAREYETFVDSSLAGCAEYLEKVTARGIQTEEADVLGEQEDMIRVMTVHVAKGLEFPLVAVVGLEYSSLQGGKSASVLPSSWLGAVTSKVPDSWNGNEKTLGKRLHQALDETENLEEQERLLYVACTRARDSLVLCGVCQRKDGKLNPDKNSWLETVLSHDRERPEIVEPASSTDPHENGSGQAFASGPRKKKAATGTQIFVAEERACSLERLSATAYALFSFCPFAYRMRYRQGLDLQWESPAEDGHGGVEAGSLAHWVLARWDLVADTLINWLPLEERKIKRIINILPPNLRPIARDSTIRTRIRRWLEGFAVGKTARVMRDSPCLQREVPFRVRIKDGPFAIGSIDALYRDAKGYHLLDYKVTASGKAPDILYENQLLFYAAAATVALGSKPSDLALYHLPEGRLHTLSPAAFDPEDILEKIQLTAKKAAQGPFEPARENCGTCPWKKKCPVSG